MWSTNLALTSIRLQEEYQEAKSSVNKRTQKLWEDQYLGKQRSRPLITEGYYSRTLSNKACSVSAWLREQSQPTMNCKVSHWFVIWNRYLVTRKKKEKISRTVFSELPAEYFPGSPSQTWMCPHHQRKHRLGHCTPLTKRVLGRLVPPQHNSFLWNESCKKSLLKRQRDEGEWMWLYPEPSFQCDKMLMRGETGERRQERKETLHSQEPYKMVTRNLRQGWGGQCLFQVSDHPLQRKGPQRLVSWVSCYSCDAVGEIPLERARSGDRKGHRFWE